MTLSEGPGRIVGSFSNSLRGIYAPLPDDLRFFVCKCNHRQITPEVEAALRKAEADYLAARP
jgi:hypothetical protein